MRHLIRIVNELNERAISFYSVYENITMDHSSATGQLMFHLFASFAEFQRNLIGERTEAGRIAARARGRFGGRPEKLKDQEIDMIQILVVNNLPIKIPILNLKLRCLLCQPLYQFLNNFHYRSNNVER